MLQGTKSRGTIRAYSNYESSGSVIRHIAQRLRQGDLSAEDVTKVYLKQVHRCQTYLDRCYIYFVQIEKTNTVINSLVAIDPDFAIRQVWVRSHHKHTLSQLSSGTCHR